MNISPAHLLLLLIIFIFTPSLQEWILEGGTVWYRAYILWFVAILFFWRGTHYYQRRQADKNNQGKNPNEL